MTGTWEVQSPATILANVLFLLRSDAFRRAAAGIHHFLVFLDGHARHGGLHVLERDAVGHAIFVMQKMLPPRSSIRFQSRFSTAWRCASVIVYLARYAGLIGHERLAVLGFQQRRQNMLN